MAHPLRRASLSSSSSSSSTSSPSDSEEEYSKAVNRDANILSQHMAALATNSDDDGCDGKHPSQAAELSAAAPKSQVKPEDQIAALMTAGFNRDQALTRAKQLYAKLWRTQGVLAEFERAVAGFHDAAYTLSAKHDEILVERQGEVAEFKALMALLGSSGDDEKMLE